MRFKATIVLSFVLILLGAYLLYIEIPGEAKKREAEIEAKRLYSFSLFEITGLTIRRPDGEIELEHFPDHPDDRWRLMRPVVTVADEKTASTLASQLERLEASRLVEVKPTDLKDFGLDPPAYTVIITLNQTDTEILEVGSKNLTGSDVYVRKGEGTSLYLVPAAIIKSLEIAPKEWRRKEVLPYRPPDIKQVRVESPRGRVEMVREGEGWSVKKPFSAKGDPSEIANFIGSLVNLRGEDFIDDQKEEKKKELGAPLLKVDLAVDQVERSASFHRLPAEPEAVYVVTTATAPIYKISSQAFKLLDQPPSSFRDKKVAALADPERVEEIEIERPEKKVHVVKRESGWVFRESPGKKVDPDKISRFLSDIYRLEAEAFVEEKDLKGIRDRFSNPQVILRLKGKEGVLIDEIRFGPSEGERVYGQSRAQSIPFFLPKDELDRIPREKDLLVSAPPPPPGPSSSPEN